MLSIDNIKIAFISLFPYTEGIPDEIYRYLNSVKYTDKCLGKLLNELTNNQETRNYNIVITSDHNVLSQESRTAFNIYNKKNNLAKQKASRLRCLFCTFKL